MFLLFIIVYEYQMCFFTCMRDDADHSFIRKQFEREASVVHIGSRSRCYFHHGKYMVGVSDDILPGQWILKTPGFVGEKILKPVIFILKKKII